MPRIPHPNDNLDSELSDFLEEGRLTCPHCGQKAKPERLYAAEAMAVDRHSAFTGNLPDHPRFKLTAAICAGCGGESLFVRKWHRDQPSDLGDPDEITEWMRRVFPTGRAKKRFPNAPEHHLKTYGEACEILDLSPAASACMSRRCLQGILGEQGYHQKDLAKQIQALLNESDPKKRLSASLHDAVDAIRIFGNFGAHPINDVTTSQIIEVAEGEAEWCIELTEDLFDHFYEQPAKLRARLDAANSKMKAGGKPPLKS